jgi:hypothetical protein
VHRSHMMFTRVARAVYMLSARVALAVDEVFVHIFKITSLIIAHAN